VVAELTGYEEIVGQDVVDELRVLAEKLRGRRLQNINSTPVGGGVAEILTRMVPLLKEIGVEATWDVIKGDQAFFNVTKAFHNALHGKQEEITPAMLDNFRETTAMNLRELANRALRRYRPSTAGWVMPPLPRDTRPRFWRPIPRPEEPSPRLHGFE